jgi:hypothetical protein
MPRVQLRDIVSSADRAAVMDLRRGPGQDQYLNSMEDIFAEADEEQRAMPHPWAVHDAGTGALGSSAGWASPEAAGTLAAGAALAVMFAAWETRARAPMLPRPAWPSPGRSPDWRCLDGTSRPGRRGLTRRWRRRRRRPAGEAWPPRQHWQAGKLPPGRSETPNGSSPGQPGTLAPPVPESRRPFSDIEELLSD